MSGKKKPPGITVETTDDTEGIDQDADQEKIEKETREVADKPATTSRRGASSAHPKEEVTDKPATVFRRGAPGAPPPAVTTESPPPPPLPSEQKTKRAVTIDLMPVAEKELAAKKKQEIKLEVSPEDIGDTQPSSSHANQPKTKQDLEDLELDEEYEIRLQKLKQQYSTLELKTKTDHKKLTEALFDKIADSVKNNVNKHKQINYPSKHESHYSKGAKELFFSSSKKIHSDITVVKEKNNFKITLPDKHSVTASFKKSENKILFTTTDSGDKSLIILLESALKAAKQMHTRNFIIYPGSNIKQIAKLCVMARHIGLIPVFKADPDIVDLAKRTQNFTAFKEALLKESGTDDPLQITIKNPPKIRDNLKPQSGQATKPSEHSTKK